MPTDLILRYSELATLTDCALKYKLAFADGLSVPASKRLVLGSAYHALMQGHYESFRDDDANGVPRDLARARKRGAQRLVEYRRGEGIKYVDDEMVEQLRWMYDGYVERWGTDEALDQFLVIDEKRLVPLVSHRGVRVILQCTADLVAHHREYSRWLILDHKTASGRDASKDATKKENQLDPQRALYTASFKLQGPKKNRLAIFGALHNVVRADQLKRPMTTEERFGRNTVYYSDTELNNIWEETKNIARDAVEIRLGVGRAKRMYSSPDPDRCSWKCTFKEVHLISRATGRNAAQVSLDYGFERAEGWEPLSVR